MCQQYTLLAQSMNTSGAIVIMYDMHMYVWEKPRDSEGSESTHRPVNDLTGLPSAITRSARISTRPRDMERERAIMHTINSCSCNY